MPWNNTIDRVTMKGYELIEILEDALSILSEDDNSYKDDFLQVSGIKMTVLVLNENAGNRIQTLKTLSYSVSWSHLTCSWSHYTFVPLFKFELCQCCYNHSL